jgi:hypothetical protein
MRCAYFKQSYKGFQVKNYNVYSILQNFTAFYSILQHFVVKWAYCKILID